MASLRNYLLAFGFFGLAAAAPACSSDSGSGGSGGGTGAVGATGGGGTSGVGATGGTGAGGAGGSAGTPTCDPGPGYKGNVTPQKVDSLNGKLVDLDGNPVGDTVTTVCGLSLCIFGSTDKDGTVVTCDKQTKLCTPGITVGQDMQKPAFKYAIGLNYAKFALLTPPGSTTVDVGTQVTAKFPDFSQGQDINAGADMVSAGVTLRLAANTKISFEPDFITAEEKRYRVVDIPMAKAPEVVDKSLNFDGLVATTPVDTDFCPHATMLFPNNYGYAAGAAVEIWIHGVDTEESWAPYGGWGKVSDATVSGDGSSIETVADQGIPMLGTFGIRKKP